MSHRFTIGVEEEFQIVDPASGELRSHVSELMEASSPGLGEQVKREMHQSIIEIGTKICADVHELDADMRRTRGELVRAAESRGLQVAAAGTHPFSSWIDQVISPGERYQNIVEEMGQLARSLLIFGMHVHVAVPDRTTMIDLMNMARYFLPHLLALSTSSPFWMGRDTGLKSFRTTVFRRFPRTGIPDHLNSWNQYEDYVELLVRLHCIDNAKKIWWDVRPHPTFGTLEFRIFDVVTRVDEAIAIAALTQAIVVKLHRLYTRNMGFRMYHRALIEENKWRAARWGIEGKLIDFGKQAEVPMSVLIEELIRIRRRRAGRTRQPRGARAHSRNFPRRHQRRAPTARVQRNRRPAGGRTAHSCRNPQRHPAASQLRRRCAAIVIAQRRERQSPDWRFAFDFVAAGPQRRTCHCLGFALEFVAAHFSAPRSCGNKRCLLQSCERNRKP